MKNTLIRSEQDATGQWWFIQKNGNRQRAKIKNCPTCREYFISYPSGGSAFCSAACIRRKCIGCDAVFDPRTNRQVYCSDDCKQRLCVCLECGAEFSPSKNAQGKYCSQACFADHLVPVGTIRPDTGGYTVIKVPRGTPGAKRTARNLWMWTHRYVMQQKLGRPLLRTEKVHHINGKRDDNRPENLELWKRSHPAGVRAADYHCAGCRCFEPGFKCS